MSGNEARSQSIEVAEELINADSLLLAELTDASNDVVLIIGRVAHDFGLADSRLCLGEVVGAVVEALVDTEELLSAVDILGEVDIVNLIDIALVHVTAEDGLENVLGSADSQQIEHAEELVLGHVTVASDVVVLEHWLQVNALVFNRSFVLFENIIDFLLVLFASKVFSAGEKSVSSSDRGDSSRWRLVNARDRKGSVHVCAEVYIAEEALWIGRLVLLGEGLELVVGQREVHGREDRFELHACDAALSELVEIAEELLDTDALHDNCSLETILDILGVIRNVNMCLSETVVDHINGVGLLPEERAHLLGAHADLLVVGASWFLGLVGGEHILRSVHVLAEVEVVDFFSVAAVAVTASNQIEHGVARRHDVEVFHYAEELLRGDVLRF